MNKKKKESMDDDWEEDFDEEDYNKEDDEEFENEDDEVFQCRVCKKNFTYETGDDYILLCDDCAENYNMDQIWSDFDTGKLREDDLKTFDLKKYKYKI